MDNCVYGPLMEEWRDIIGYEGYYKISNYGLVKSMERGIETKVGNRNVKETTLTNSRCNGYFHVTLYKNKKRKIVKVHQLIGLSFFNIDNKTMFLNHKNLIGIDNFILNFDTVTSRENACHYKLNKDGPRKFIGSLIKETGRWRSRIYINKKYISLGVYSTQMEAHEAYKKELEKNGIVNKYI